MSNSLVLMHSRANDLHIIDPDEIPHTDDLPPLLLIAVAVIKAGYTGVAVDELKLSNGRIVHSVELNLETPEGKIFQKLSAVLESGRPLPEANTVLEAIRLVYESIGRLQKLHHPNAKENK